MTLAEVIRHIESRKRRQKIEAQQQAIFDYIQADLIGRSVSRLYSSSNRLPTLEEAYTSLFDDEDIKAKQQQKKDELSVLRFKQFAQSYNDRFNKEVAKTQ